MAAVALRHPLLSAPAPAATLGDHVLRLLSQQPQSLLRLQRSALLSVRQHPQHLTDAGRPGKPGNRLNPSHSHSPSPSYYPYPYVLLQMPSSAGADRQTLWDKSALYRSEKAAKTKNRQILPTELNSDVREGSIDSGSEAGSTGREGGEEFAKTCSAEAMFEFALFFESASPEKSAQLHSAMSHNCG